MNEQSEIVAETGKPENDTAGMSSWLRAVSSLLVFGVVYYVLFRNWSVVLILIVVLLIHESGHYIAMKLFGYKDIHMVFIPFAGAYVSGETSNLSNRNKLIVLLAGPLPGIAIGTLLMWLHHRNNESIYLVSAAVFLLQNTFNLLPIFPLDGGQFFRALFCDVSNKTKLIFFYLLLAFVVFIGLYPTIEWMYLIAALPIAIKIWRTHYLYRIHKKLDEAGVAYDCNYDDLTDEEYRQIRNVVVADSAELSSHFAPDEPDEQEDALIPYIEKVLVTPYNDTLTLWQKMLFLLLWAAAFISPVYLWMWHEGKVLFG